MAIAFDGTIVTDQLKSLPSYDNAVKTHDGKIENFTLKIAGKSYRCDCGCNVFHKPNKTRLDIYRCNSCDKTFETE